MDTTSIRTVITGNFAGTQWVATEIPELTRVSGDVLAYGLRQSAGGLASAVDIYLVESTATPALATPDDLDCPIIDTGHIPTASASTASLHRTLGAGLASFGKAKKKWWLLRVTSTGAFTINIDADVRRDRA